MRLLSLLLKLRPAEMRQKRPLAEIVAGISADEYRRAVREAAALHDARKD